MYLLRGLKICCLYPILRWDNKDFPQKLTKLSGSWKIGCGVGRRRGGWEYSGDGGEGVTNLWPSTSITFTVGWLRMFSLGGFRKRLSVKSNISSSDIILPFLASWLMLFAFKNTGVLSLLTSLNKLSLILQALLLTRVWNLLAKAAARLAVLTVMRSR